ncbi:helix-turn-helix domain-containing protein [Ideonella sp. A 288]|uniref:helix-turn-helix domain-containing protein n=1 Tax=Ideonella sp. A 288 TaxID=1962181 RepID=UPI0021008345|nr:helix-turn-helix domain-containing protein [Ideonella sp. A 288]
MRVLGETPIAVDLRLICATNQDLRARVEAGTFREVAQARATGTLEEYIRECERGYILQALQRCQGQVGQTAAYLGISRKNLWEKMKRLQIQPRTLDPDQVPCVGQALIGAAALSCSGRATRPRRPGPGS